METQKKQIKKPLEKHIEKQICDWLSWNNIYFKKIKIKGELHSIKGILKLRKSNNCGFPDILCCIKGKFVGIEVKREKNSLQSDAQEIAEIDIIRAGGIYILTYSLEYLQKTMKEKGLI